MSADLRNLAETRIREAIALLATGEPAGAYYLAGLAVECGLKACIASQFNRYEVPDKKLVTDMHTHDLEKLVRLADLGTKLTTRAKDPDDFDVFWTVVKDWEVESRYELPGAQEAQDLIDAIKTEPDGVLPWLRSLW